MGNKLRKVHLYIKKKSPSDFIRFEFDLLIKSESNYLAFSLQRGEIKLFLAIHLIDGLLIIRKNISLLKE
jgi:hypothetical protein